MKLRQLFLFFTICLSLHLQGQIPKKADKFFQQARMETLSGNTENALELLNKAIKIHPKYTEALALRAKIYSDAQDWDKAKEAYLDIAVVSPSEAWKVYFQLGRMEMEQQKYTEAIAEFERCQQESNIPKKTADRAAKNIENCRFRINAMKNPVPFEAVSLGDSINSNYDEYLPTFTADGQEIYFTRRIGEGARADEDFYRSVLVEGEWTKAQDVGKPINTEASSEGALTISPDGKRLFFAANKPDRPGGFDIFYSYQVEGEWLMPTTIHRPVNTRHWESQPSISADGKELYFTSKRNGGYGGIDIWVSRLVDNQWQEPENLGEEINTPEDDQCPFIHPDGMTMYFSSKGHLGMGDADIFKATRQADGTWGDVQNIGYPINTSANENSMVVNTAGDKAYYSRFVEGNGFDLFSFDLPKEAQPMFVTYVKGKVYDQETQKMLDAQVEIIDLESGKTLQTLNTDKVKGDFLLTLPSGKDYAFNVSKEDYLFYSDHFSLKDKNTSEPYLLDIGLQSVKVGESTILKNIFFETAKYELKSSSFVELDKLVSLLKENPSMNIKVIGHTDNVGDESGNLMLSKNRAKSVYDYLVGKGIDRGRLSFDGKGETQPIAANDTEDGRAENRRTEFVIVK